ncbi:HpcH/HpaI aldolase family protein [Pseudonocardia xishanensis]|uniref:2-keto-3-deoxy-L-rhamnonate aldolase n=1 Tax=Pseudonocardia xishanensis TaxID=630995 RepID=A0ABP8RZN8_9PSEU
MIGNGARTRFTALLDQGKVPLGMFVACEDPAFTEILGRSGYDFAILDAEHSHMGPADLLGHVRAADVSGLVPVVRVWENSRPLIQKFLDIGAEGIVVPHVDTAEQAAAAVAATRFPPHGERSICPTNHASGYSIAYWDAYREHSLENVLVIPIIESATALENLESILAVDGIDYVFFGPGDYSLSIGVAMDAPEVGLAWERARALARAAGKRVMTTDNVPGLSAGQAGAIVHGMDLMHVSEWAVGAVAALRARYDNPAGVDRLVPVGGQ